MRFFRKRPEPRDPGLQLTAMIDVVFLLVVFFMCTADLSRREVDSAIVLPVAYSGSPEEGATGRVVVNVGRGGEFRVMAAGYNREGLERLLSEEAARHRGGDGGPDVAVKIRADADAPYGCVAQVMAACRKAGIRKLSFGAQAPAADSEDARKAG